MLHVAVVEDEEGYRKQLQDMIDRYAQENKKQIKVIPFSSGSELVENYKRYDLLLLDIEMAGLNGMDTAEKIRETDKEVVIVFITNMAQYAIKGYEVDALDFILKPVNYYTFSMRFARAITRVKNREGRKIQLNLPDGPRWLNSQDIYYVEILNRMLHYHTADGEFVIRGTLKDAHDQLEEWSFAKCNQCYLINLRHVSKIRKNTVVVGTYEVEISRRNRNMFLAAVTDYLSG